ncbi:8-oxo-dGTP diphosphatase [Candidatus Uhrbacteria bacterium]|nr:8-oxo-dGTP diphosphatase [Candidatus Uhrbacteria bacterium]
MKTILTLCMIYNDTHILLGRKKRGLGTGFWNGFGGHVEDGEAIADAAVREVKEEAGIMPRDVQHRGVLDFEIATHPELLQVHVFSAQEFKGEPRETGEMEPRWFTHREIPFDQMWKDDRYWLPLLLQGNNFEGAFYFKDNDTLVNHVITEIGRN